MTDAQTAERTKPVADVVPRSPSGVPITPGDPRFMTRDAAGNLINPDGTVYVPEEQPRTVHHALADLAAEIEALWHSTPSGTESAVVRMRGHLRELRGLVDPDSEQAKADATKRQEDKLRAQQELKAAQAQAAADARAADEVRARQQQQAAAKPKDATG